MSSLSKMLVVVQRFCICISGWRHDWMISWRNDTPGLGETPWMRFMILYDVIGANTPQMWLLHCIIYAPRVWGLTCWCQSPAGYILLAFARLQACVHRFFHGKVSRSEQIHSTPPRRKICAESKEHEASRYLPRPRLGCSCTAGPRRIHSIPIPSLLQFLQTQFGLLRLEPDQKGSVHLFDSLPKFQVLKETLVLI